LLEEGEIISEKTVGRYMKEMSLNALPTKMYVVTTDSNHADPVAPNILKRNFTTKAPNEVWVADITYIRTVEGWLYLSSVMDLFSRKIVGWYLSDHMKAEATLEALKMAMAIRQPGKGFIHHSDRGAQYCSADYRACIEAAQGVMSMSRKGDPYDNACIESFHATLKKECIYRRHFQTKAEAKTAVNQYIGSFYNKTRKHSTLGYLSPVNFELKFQSILTARIS